MFTLLNEYTKYYVQYDVTKMPEKCTQTHSYIW